MSSGPSFEAAANEIRALLESGGVPVRAIGDETVVVRGFAPVDRAGAHDLAFIRSERYLGAWASSGAGVTLVSAALMEHEAARPLEAATDRAVFVVPDADLALVALLGYAKGAMPTGDPDAGVHPSAIVDESATVGAGVRIGPFAVIQAGAEVGDDAVVRAHAVVGLGARIGDRTVLREHVTVGDRCEVGADCILHAGAVIGADGFGYRPPAPELGTGPWPVKIPHIGIVKIGDHVEIGANSCVDRATYGVTSIGDGVKLDNHVQIGHNCTIGPGTIICGCSGLGGSARVGAGVTIGGGVGVIDHVVIGDGATITARSGVTREVPAGAVLSGMPATPSRRHLRKQASLEWLTDAIGPLRELLREKGHKG